MNASPWNNPGPIKGHGLAAGYQHCYAGGRVCSESLRRAIFIYPLPGSLPVGPISCPPRSSPKIRISSNFAPRVLIRGRQDGENFWKLLSIPIFLHFVTSGSGDEVCNVVTVRRVIIQPVDRNWREISKFLIGNGVHSSDRIG